MNNTNLTPHIWALADLHLSFGTPNKGMEVFGEQWNNWIERTKQHWTDKVSHNDLVLLPGDISWAKHLEEATPDLEWINQLPGTKVMIKGNHDYWWGSIKKTEKILPETIHLIQNNIFTWQDVSIGGARLWDSPEYDFMDYIVITPNDRCKPLTEIDTNKRQMEKIFERELIRLEMSLKELDQQARLRIVMTHYPPIGADLAPSRVSKLLEKYNVDICVFGHLHSVRPESLPFGKKNGVHYHLVSGDYVGFDPLLID